jgi:hypothetical protein
MSLGEGGGGVGRPRVQFLAVVAAQEDDAAVASSAATTSTTAEAATTATTKRMIFSGTKNESSTSSSSNAADAPFPPPLEVAVRVRIRLGTTSGSGGGPTAATAATKAATTKASACTDEEMALVHSAVQHAVRLHQEDADADTSATISPASSLIIIRQQHRQQKPGRLRVFFNKRQTEMLWQRTKERETGVHKGNTRKPFATPKQGFFAACRGGGDWPPSSARIKGSAVPTDFLLLPLSRCLPACLSTKGTKTLRAQTDRPSSFTC